MPTPTKGPRLGGGPSHERLMIANLARSLFAEGRIRTTEAKAKRLRPQAERLITFAKRGDVASRRQVLTVVRDKAVVHKLFAEIAPRFADRAGGYTRVLRLGPRPGDAAPMALIELVERGAEGDGGATASGERRRRFGRRPARQVRPEAGEEPTNRAGRRAAARRGRGAAAEEQEVAATGDDGEELPAVPTDADVEAGAELLDVGDDEADEGSETAAALDEPGESGELEEADLTADEGQPEAVDSEAEVEVEGEDAEPDGEPER